MEAKLRDYREEAEARVLEHPVLLKAGIVDRYLSKETTQAKHALSREGFERIRDELYESAGDDMAMAIARANALCRIAKIVNRRTDQGALTPAPVINVRRPLDNAFLPGMFEAVLQIDALRDHVGKLGKDTERTMASACARAVLAMALFGYCEIPEQIYGALQRRNLLLRPEKLPDTILVPWGDRPHEVMALRGLAAIAFARVHKKFRKAPVPGWGEIEAQLQQYLPDWAVKGTDWRKKKAGSLIGVLCETAGVANRFELSPAARLANAKQGGSTPAHLREQVALIDGDPAGTLMRDWENDASRAASSVGTASLLSASGPRKGNARSQYLALCRVFPSTAKDTQLPLTGEVIPSGQAAASASRAKVVAEIQDQMAQTDPERRLQPIVQLLAGWVLDMLNRGTPGTANPALSTIETYLARVGGGLIHIFGQSSLDGVTEAELEDAYLTVVASSKESCAKAAAAVLLFHAYALEAWGLPAPDLSSVLNYLEDPVERLADARLVLPAERAEIMTRLRKEATSPPAGLDQHGSRVLRQASLAFPLLAYGGARRSEPLGIQFRDLEVEGNTLRVRIRPNQSRRLKTVNARRYIEIPLESASVKGTNLAEWALTERQRIHSRRLETAYVFSAIDSPSDATQRDLIAEACLAKCREVTGRKQSRLHAFRHLVGTELATAPFLTDDDLAALKGTVPMTRPPTQKGRLALPRDLQHQAIRLGHANPETTLKSYHHLPWLLRSRAEARLNERYSSRVTAASLLDVSLFTVDHAWKTRPGRPQALAWLDVQCDVREVPEPQPAKKSLRVVPNATSPVAQNKTFGARALGELLAETSRIGSLEKALSVRGGRAELATALQQSLVAIEQQLGRLLNVFIGPFGFAGVVVNQPYAEYRNNQDNSAYHHIEKRADDPGNDRAAHKIEKTVIPAHIRSPRELCAVVNAFVASWLFSPGGRRVENIVSFHQAGRWRPGLVNFHLQWRNYQVHQHPRNEHGNSVPFNPLEKKRKNNGQRFHGLFLACCGRLASAAWRRLAIGGHLPAALPCSLGHYKKPIRRLAEAPFLNSSSLDSRSISDL